ncbi:ChaN family lipoprotein [Brumimicrobium aurantiacum]|uniref:Iron-regulated protein n=1 Tax=Brumimicrobium aurantiacum TaxID=1737063 RepID=A0A3E1F1X8_9FLAO|nr:ChaN family lipoprotein [Brumimicrobium aurantiacum]RFC55805.1 iron-regulated protein [Brumimicrobium aurantiacum]
MKNLLILLFAVSHFAFGQNVEPFQLYNKKGKKIKTKKFFKKIDEGQIILFGELHNNPIAHWMQLKTTQVMNENKTISLGAEMLEANNQEQLDAYLKGEITQQELDSTASLWMNYKTDYKPLVDHAKENNLNFIATNVPRKYASHVYRNGLESLDTHLTVVEKNWIAPLPIAFDPELPNYKAMLTMMSDHANPNFPKAQAIKDATMAHFIYQEYAKNQNQFIHFNGDYHSKDFEGIYWYLKRQDESLNIITISTVEQSDVNTLNEEFVGQADYILVVDKDMTKTY